MKTTIVGTGMIGRAWAVCFARGGSEVTLWNRSEASAHAALEYIRSLLPMLESNDLLHGNSADAILSRLRVVVQLEDALADADYVQENVAEDIAVKTSIYSQLEAHCRSDTIFGSSTSGILPTDFTQHLNEPERCLVVHPLNPPYLIPAVDVVPSQFTSSEVLEKTTAWLRTCGQAPILMESEDRGFLTIRLQGALYHEAWRLVASGLAGPEDVDATIREGLALRWSFMGPFETADLNAQGGIREFVKRFGQLFHDLYPKDGPVDWNGKLMDRVEAARRRALPMDQHVERQLWRDKRLIALASHKRQQDKQDAAK